MWIEFRDNGFRMWRILTPWSSEEGSDSDSGSDEHLELEVLKTARGGAAAAHRKHGRASE